MRINSLSNFTPNNKTTFGYNLKLSSDRQEFLDYCIQERKEKFYFNDRDEHQRYIKALNYFNEKTFNATKMCDYYGDRIKLYDEEYYNKWLKFCKDLTTPEEVTPKKEKKSIFSIFKRKKAEKPEMPDMSNLEVDIKGCYYGWDTN